MPRIHSNRDRPVHLGPLPVERLPREPDAPVLPARQPGDAGPAGPDSVMESLMEYIAVAAALFDGAVAAKTAPLPEDPVRLSEQFKAAAVFLDATLAGVCRLAPEEGSRTGHTHALVFAVEFGRDPAANAPGADWIRGTHAARSDLRCAEVPQYWRATSARSAGLPPGMCMTTRRSICRCSRSALVSLARSMACSHCLSRAAVSVWAW
ncbi:MAG: hypothetical protein ACKO4A_02310 [Gammaproteobacteria bacterium]